MTAPREKFATQANAEMLAEVRDDVWWGSVNIKLDPQSFLINRERAFAPAGGAGRPGRPHRKAQAVAASRPCHGGLRAQPRNLWRTL